MQGNCLSTEQVVTGRDIGWNRNVHSAAALVQVVCAPVIVVTNTRARLSRPAVGEDLVPAGGAVGSFGVFDLGHVDLDRAVMGTANGL